MRVLLVLLLFTSLSVSGQNTYKELSEKAIEYIEKDSLQKAEDLLGKALKLEPNNLHNTMLLSNLGLIQKRMGQYTKALESYNLAINLAPLAVPILLDRAALLMEMGEQNKAYVDYCMVLDVDKQNKEAILMRAYIYLNRKDYNAARMDYNRLLELDPKNYSGRLGLVTLYQKQTKFREALELIAKMIVEHPEDPVLYITRASIELDMNHEDLALIDLDEAIKLDKSLPDAYLLRGNIYLNQKRKSLAKADFEKAISLGVPAADLHEQITKCK